MAAPASEFKIRTKLVIDEASLNTLKEKIASGLGLADIIGKGKTGAAAENIFGISKTHMGAMLKGVSAFGRVGEMAATAIGGATKIAGLFGVGKAKKAPGVAGEEGVEKLVETTGEGLKGVTSMLGNIIPGIGTAVGAAVGVVIGEVIAPMLKQTVGLLREASPMFGAILDLTKTMVNMILKPFADGFALFVLPIIVWMFKYLILPFYQYVYPAIIRMVEFMEPLYPGIKLMILALTGLILPVLIMAIVALMTMVALFMLLSMHMTALAAIGKWLVENIGGFFTTVVEGIVAFFTTLWGIQWAVISGAFSVVVRTVTLIIEKVAWLGTWIAEKVVWLGGLLIDAFWGAIGWIWGLMSTVFTGIKDAIVAFPGALWDVITWLGTTVMDIWDTVSSAITSFFGSKIEWLWGVVERYLSPVLSAVDVAKGYLSTVIGWLDNIWDILKNTIGDILTKIKSVIDGVKKAITDLGGFLEMGLFAAMGPLGPGGAGELGPLGAGAGSNYQFFITQHVYGTMDPEATAERSSKKFADDIGILMR